MSSKRVAVVGAGMAGLGAAHRLSEAGFDVTVFEADDHVGGRVWTIRRGDFLMDLGAAVYLGTYQNAMDLMHELGLGDQLRESPAIGAIPRGDKVHYFDYSTPVRTLLRTGAISPWGKLRALKLGMLFWRHRNQLGYNDYAGVAGLDTETVRQYSHRELTPELLAYVTEPLVRGTWAADDYESSNALLLWTIRNMLVPTVFNLDSGCDGLPREIASRLDVRLEHPVGNVTDHGEHVDVTYSSGGREQTDRFDGCVIATTAGPAVSMYPQMDENHRELYETTRYRGLITVCLGLSRRPSDPATYILLPETEDPNVIAVIADHLKARGRAPAGKAMYTLLFSHEYLHRSKDRSDEDVLADAIACVSRFHGDISDSLEEHFIRRWDEVVPVIDAGRFKRIVRFTQRLDPTARVQFASDLDRIPGLNGALVSGFEAAARMVSGNRSWSSARETIGVGD
jgi:oxygen-dependent protoporphyrinogen oxidase